jgi:hypothetical protein
MNTDIDRPEDEKPDLKHDTMEFAANTEADDIIDEENLEDDELVSSEELEMLEDDPEVEAAALSTVEMDLLSDEDNLPEEDWLDDIPGGNAEEDDDEDGNEDSSL